MALTGSITLAGSMTLTLTDPSQAANVLALVEALTGTTDVVLAEDDLTITFNISQDI